MSHKDWMKNLMMSSPDAPEGVVESKSSEAAGVAEASAKGVNALPRRGRSAPAAMVMQIGREFELEAKLAQYEGSLPVKPLDPARIRRSPRFANRDVSHFGTARFAELRDQIRDAGGNTVPIKVRPVIDDPAHDYEIVYGLRRHQACAELGLPVLALIAETDEETAYREMTRENLARTDLSPYEWGRHYMRVLKDHCEVMGRDPEDYQYRTISALSASVGVSLSTISKSIAIATLPPVVLAAFPSPTEIQFREGAVLNELLADEARGKALLERAAKLVARLEAGDAKDMTGAREVYEYLIDKPASVSKEVRVKGKRAAKIVFKNGNVSVNFAKGRLSADQLDSLAKVIQEFMDS